MRDEADWRLLNWLAYGLLIAAVFLAGGLWSVVVVGFGGSTCGEMPTRSEARSGQHSLLLTVALALLPWAVACLASPQRWVRFLVAALVSASPPLILLLTHLRVADWRGSFCF